MNHLIKPKPRNLTTLNLFKTYTNVKPANTIRIPSKITKNVTPKPKPAKPSTQTIELISGIVSSAACPQEAHHP